VTATALGPAVLHLQNGLNWNHCYNLLYRRNSRILRGERWSAPGERPGSRGAPGRWGREAPPSAGDTSSHPRAPSTASRDAVAASRPCSHETGSITPPLHPPSRSFSVTPGGGRRRMVLLFLPRSPQGSLVTSHTTGALLEERL